MSLIFKKIQILQKWKFLSNLKPLSPSPSLLLSKYALLSVFCVLLSIHI